MYEKVISYAEVPLPPTAFVSEPTVISANVRWGAGWEGGNLLILEKIRSAYRWASGQVAVMSPAAIMEREKRDVGGDAHPVVWNNLAWWCGLNDSFVWWGEIYKEM